jgi:hypothetical protein
MKNFPSLFYKFVLPSSQGNAESVKILLDAALYFQLGPDVMLGRGLYGETPLHHAALRAVNMSFKKFSII